ncbi:hypothetical protein [Mycobacterium neumannii]|uniref:hypothetical protein n=1 Tax=Mycobacterium neumannii TaxID=2048551 RepID=UPI000F843430|nr:hypothetical protein [Mycobacterium neumannii]
MRPPAFLKVSPAEIGRVGPLGACILALVRYVTALPGESNGRRIIDGEMWWCASHDDIGQALGAGVPRRTVSATVRKLQGMGDLSAVSRQDFYGDRAQAYRASDVPLARSDQGCDVPLADIAHRSADSAEHLGGNRRSSSADFAGLPLPEELGEEGETGELAACKSLNAEPVPNDGNDPPPPDSSDKKPQLVDVEEVEPASRELVTQRIDGIDGIDAIVGEVADDPEPEPQPYCDRHMPRGTDNSCGACGRRRRIREVWAQRQNALSLERILAKAAEPARPERAPWHPVPKPEPPSWIPGLHGPRCRRHGHLQFAPADCAGCRGAAVAAGESA